LIGEQSLKLQSVAGGRHAHHQHVLRDTYGAGVDRDRIEIHKEELQVDWQLAVNGEEPFRIAPLQ
jgi:hypothetical protein